MKTRIFLSKLRYWEHQYFLTGVKIILNSYKSCQDDFYVLLLTKTQKRKKWLQGEEKNSAP
jgi:hypothetical protein